MKRSDFFVFFYVFFSLFLGMFKLFSMGEDFSDGDKPFSQRVEEGVSGDMPSRLTFSGSLSTTGWVGDSSDKSHTYTLDKLDGSTGTEKTERVIKSALGASAKGSVGALWEFTPFSGANLSLSISEGGIKPGKFMVYTDIAGELKNEYIISKLSFGQFGFGPKSFSPAGPMGAGFSKRHSSTDTINIQTEIGTRKSDIFPIKLVLASDMDLGITSKYRKKDWNNKGASYLIDLQSANFKLSDVVGLSWNLYYGHRVVLDKEHGKMEAPPAPGVALKLKNYVNKKQHSIGGTVGVSIPIGDLITFKPGVGVEYNNWKFVGVGDAFSKLKGRNFQVFEWQAGANLDFKDIISTSLSVRQDTYNHIEYAVLNKESPYTEFITGFSLEYLQLKKIAKVTFHAAVGANFGSLYSSEKYKRARHGVDSKIYSDYAVNIESGGAGANVANPTAVSRFSADAGVGYHPVKGASIYTGYRYGKHAFRALGAAPDFQGSLGQFYIAAKYSW